MRSFLGQIIGLLSFGLLIAFLITVAVYGAPVHAAPPDVPPCEAINTLPDGSITVYRCEPNEGLSYKINSLGFMLLED